MDANRQARIFGKGRTAFDEEQAGELYDAMFGEEQAQV